MLINVVFLIQANSSYLSNIHAVLLYYSILCYIICILALASTGHRGKRRNLNNAWNLSVLFGDAMYFCVAPGVFVQRLYVRPLNVQADHGFDHA